MSPEQTRASGVDARSDLWSLGVVIYELLTGRQPFVGASDGVVIHGIRNDTPLPLHELRPDAPATLVAVFQRCLEKDPAARFESAAALLAELEAAAEAGAPAPMRSTSRRSAPARAAAVVFDTVAVALAAYVAIARDREVSPAVDEDRVYRAVNVTIPRQSPPLTS